MDRPLAMGTQPILAEAGARVGLGRPIMILAGLAAAVLLPFLLSNFHVFQLTTVLVYAIALLGLNLLTGFTGQISVGHGAFFAIGAYSASILIDRLGVPYWATVPIAGALALALGFLFGLPALRLEGLYLALATFALGVTIPQILKLRALEFWTGGVLGITLDKPEVPPGLPINQDQWLYFFVLGIALLMLVLARNLTSARIGRAMIAIRDNPIAAASMGVNLALFKSATFGVSAGFTGVAGALSVLIIQFVSPDSFPIFLSITLMVGVVVGGLGSVLGSIFGALFVVLVPNVAGSISKALPWAIYGASMIVFMYFAPDGFGGLARRMADAVRVRATGRMLSDAVAKGGDS